MGAHKNITHDKFPAQGKLLNERVRVCFHYVTSNVIEGICIRDDAEEPRMTIFQLDNGRTVLATECQYSHG